MFEIAVRIVFSLLVVLGLMWALARLARRPLGLRRGGMVTVLGRQQLSRGASVAVVRVVDRALVLGITDAQVTLLGETDLEAIEEYQPEPAVHRTAVSLDELVTIGEVDGAARRLGAVEPLEDVGTTGTQPPPAPTASPSGAGSPGVDPSEAGTTAGGTSSVDSATTTSTAGTPTDKSDPGRSGPGGSGPGRSDPGSSARSRPSLDKSSTVRPGVAWPGTKPTARSPLAGSALSPDTWRQTLRFIRERLGRKP